MHEAAIGKPSPFLMTSSPVDWTIRLSPAGTDRDAALEELQSLAAACTAAPIAPFSETM